MTVMRMMMMIDDSEIGDDTDDDSDEELEATPKKVLKYLLDSARFSCYF